MKYIHRYKAVLLLGIAIRNAFLFNLTCMRAALQCAHIYYNQGDGKQDRGSTHLVGVKEAKACRQQVYQLSIKNTTCNQFCLLNRIQ